MMIFFIMVSLSVYFCMIYSLVYYRIVPISSIISFTDMTMSALAYSLVAILGAFLGIYFGKKWWQIIYVDKVYYFDKKSMPNTKRKVVRKMAKKETCIVCERKRRNTRVIEVKR